MVSTALGEDVRRRVTFDIPAIVEANQEQIPITVEPAPSAQHGTTIVLSDLHRPIPTGRTLGKIRAYLGSIYRGYLGPDFQLVVKGEEVGFERPPILVQPRWDGQRAMEAVSWKKDVAVTLPSGAVVTGWAALREKGSTREAGLALLYRGKVVVGAGAAAGEPEDLYRPVEIFGGGNSFISQRLFGELDVSGLRVTHSKDAIIWDGQEEVLLVELKRQLDEEPLPLLKMATNHRVNERSTDILARVDAAIRTTAAAAEGTHLPEIAPEDGSDGAGLGLDLSDVSNGGGSATDDRFVATQEPFSITVAGSPLDLLLTVSDQRDDVWIRITDLEERHLITITRDHPFMRSFAHLPNQEIEPVLRLAVAIGVAELAARRGGAQGASQVRAQLNAALQGTLGNSTLTELREAAT